MSERRAAASRVPAVAGVRHGRQRRSRVWRGLLGLVGIVAAVSLVVTGSVVGIAIAHISQNVTERAVDIAGEDAAPLPSIGEFEGGFNIMIVGVDNDPDQNSDAYGDRGTAILNDVNILLHVAGDHQSATAVSIPRDMVVPIPSCDREDGSGKNSAMTGRPINEAYYYGGLKCVADTVSNLTGLDIPFAGVITFDGVIGMSNVVGGVDVCIDGPIFDRYTGLNLPAAGTYTLQGLQAEQFVRTRHGVGDGSDLGRISSQQVFMSALVRKLKSEDTLNDLGKLYQIAETATTNMKLSTSLTSLDTMVSIARALKDIPLERVTFVQYPGTTGQGGIYTGKVAPITGQANALFAKLRADESFLLDSNAVGANGGSVLDPNAPVATPDPNATADPNAPALDTLAGIKGQTAAQYTCASANN